MHVLTQKNIWNEYGYDRLLNSFDRNGIRYTEVNVIPFTDELDKAIDFTPDYIFGSNRFVNICRIKGYHTFPSFKPVEDFYDKDYYINGNGYWCKWKDLKISDPKFIKPLTEKFFTGRIVENQNDLNKIQLATSFIDNEDEELIWVTDPVQIYNEVRFFVIGGEVITGSLYKIKGNNKQKRIDYMHPAWYACVDILKTGIISDGFVIDLGQINRDDCSSSWKIVELNNINSAGLYECDTDAIVRALKQLG